MTILSPNGTKYEVKEERLGSTDEFTLYECTLPDKSPAILKIAKTLGNNGLLDREAYILGILKEGAEELEKDYFEVTEGKKSPLNNHYFFPQLVESFIASDQDNRRVSILSLSHVSKKLAELMPLSFISVNNNRVDPRTSAWILGKLLKLLVFTHGLGIELGQITADNILINQRKHYVCMFDWSKAVLCNGEISSEVAGREIAQITREVIKILGCSEDGELPKDEQLVDDSYEKFLKNLTSGFESDSYTAHKKFYELIWSLWPHGFHPFTTHSI